MKKHAFSMVFLLILAMLLIGAVSASENITSKASNIELSKEDCQMQTQTNDKLSNEIEISCDDSLLKDNDNKKSSGNLDYQSSVDSNHISSDDFELVKDISFDFKNSSHYDISYNITNTVYSLYNVNNSDNVFVFITSDDINTKTIGEVVNGIVNASNGYVSYNNDNLLTLSNSKTDLNIAFFINTTESYRIVSYNGAKKLLYTTKGLSADFWNFNLNSLINGFSSDYFANTLNELALLDDMYTNEIQDYPQNNKFDLPLENTLNNDLRASRDSDDHAFIWSIEKNNPDKKAYIGVDVVDESITGLVSANLNDTNVVDKASIIPSDQLEQIGIDAANMALSYFKSKGIDIQKGYPYLYTLTSAGYVKINGTNTGYVNTGISDVLGSILFDNLIPIHNPLWKDLVFYFLWVDSTDNTNYLSYALKYDPVTGEFSVSPETKKQGNDIAYSLNLYEHPTNSHKTDDDKKSTGKHNKNISKNTKQNKTFVNNIANIQDFGSPRANNTFKNNNSNTSTGVFKNSVEKSIPFEFDTSNIVYILLAILVIFGVFFGIVYLKN